MKSVSVAPTVNERGAPPRSSVPPPTLSRMLEAVPSPSRLHVPAQNERAAGQIDDAAVQRERIERFREAIEIKKAAAVDGDVDGIEDLLVGKVFHGFPPLITSGPTIAPIHGAINQLARCRN